jgi:hypothetical protein
MKDPERLSEAGGADPGAALLRSAKRYRLSEESRKRALATVGLTAGSAALATGEAIAKGAAVGGKALGWIVAGVVCVVAGGGVYLALAPGGKVPAPAAPTASIAVDPLPTASAPQAVAAPSGAPVEPSSAAAPRPLPVSAPRHGAVVRGASSANLQAEVVALDAASKAIARGDGPGALARLDAYERQFPRGSLGLEATVLRVEALDRAGRHGEAVKRAGLFVERHPKSPLADRMRRLADE